jgi:hypothetical protein
MAPPSNAATTRRSPKPSNSNCSALDSIRMEAPVGRP